MCPFDGVMNVWKTLDEKTLSLIAVVATVISIVGVLIWNYWSKRKENDLMYQLKKGHFGPVQNKSSLDQTKSEQKTGKLEPKEEKIRKCPVFVETDTPGLLTKKENDDMDDLPELEETQSPSKKPQNKTVRFDAECKADDSDDVEKVNEILSGKSGQKLHGALQTADLRLKTKQMEHDMSVKEKEDEANIRKRQLEAIFSLMKQQEEKFGTQSQEDVKEQMKLYSF